jgi:hypothetical protein
MKLRLRAAVEPTIPGDGGLNKRPHQWENNSRIRWSDINNWRKINELPPLSESDYVLKEIPLDSVTLLQFGEDYDNDSSRETAKHYYRVHVKGQEPDYPGDFLPIVIDEEGRIIDGHHRHCAHKILGRKFIWAYVPKSVADKF